MSKFKHLSDLEVQQITFDWRYKGFTVLELITEEECDIINDELDRLRNERTGTEAPDGKIWGEWDPFAYPHKLSPLLEKYFAHPKILEAVEQTAPMRRNVTIDDVGNTAAFLLSDLANGITADIIYVDNGFSQVVGGMEEV